MAIAFEAALAPAASFTAGGPTGTVTTGALNASATADRCVAMLVIAQTSAGTDNAINGVTYGGVSMTADTERSIVEYGTYGKGRLFYLTAAPSGSNTFVISFTNGTSVHLGWAAVAYSGVASVSNVTYNGAAAYNAAPTITLTSPSGDTALGLFGWPADQAITSTGSGVTTKIQGLTDGSAGRIWIAEKAGVGSMAIDGTAAGNCAGWYGWALSMAPASGGGSSTTPLVGGLTHGILTKGRLVA